MPRNDVLTVPEWVAKGRPQGVPLRSPLGVETKAAADSEREIVFRASDATVDFDNEIVSPAGWQLDRYRKNPVFLWEHDIGCMPIGKAVEIGVENGQLLVRVEFAGDDIAPAGEDCPGAEAVLKAYKTGFLNAVSVQFMPLERDFSPQDSVIRTLRAELLEISAVVVPCNPNAVAVRRSAGHAAAARRELAAALLR